MNTTSIPFLAPYVRIHTDRITGRPLLLGPEIALDLTESGVEILLLCDGKCTLGEIAEHLADEYEADGDEILEDVKTFLVRLSDKGYVQWK